MAGTANGRPVEPSKTQKQSTEQTIGKALPVRRPNTVTVLAAKAVNWGTWLLVWYAIITALFRCPGSADDLSESSPKVCRPYLSARSYTGPYVEPYYNKYAASHVEKVRPHLERLNEHLLVPAAQHGRHYYELYGAEKVGKARDFGLEKWEQVLKPQVDTAQKEAKKQYSSKLAPHVDKASAAAAPYVTASKENVNEVYNNHILPTYGSIRPRLEGAYAQLYAIVTETIIPHVQSAWSSTVVFINRTIWPKIRIAYGRSVEPQLFRIGQRLGRYRDGKKVQDAMENGEDSTTSSSLSPTVASVSTPTVSDEASSTAATTSSLHPEQEAALARARIEDDLRSWQEKYRKAADKGFEDLQERIEDVTSRQIESQAHGTGNALLIRLEETVSQETKKLRKKIKSVVQHLPEEATASDFEEADESISKATKAAGLAVKQEAQAVRDWKEAFNRETLSLVNAASTSTLEVIDSIRDLGLQEIGLKWAKMEGVTFKDWSKYHDVKKSFDEWQTKIRSAAKDHPGLQKSINAGEEIEAKGMAAAEDAANELSRLKRVGTWKVQAKDSSDDFSTRAMPAAAAVNAKKAASMASAASEAVVGTSQGVAESLASAATQAVSEGASDASSVIIGTEPGYAEQAASKASQSASRISEQVSEAIGGSDTPAVQSVASAARNKAENFASDASEAIIGTPPPAHESLASEISEQASSKVGEASSIVSESSSVISDHVSEAASKGSSSASSVASKASAKVYGGAMAAEVHGQKPILDDIVDDGNTYSEKLQSLVEEAGDRYTELTKAVREAIHEATTTSQGTIQSASSMADEQYSKALLAASKILYGEEQGTIESATSIASEKWQDAVAAASSVIYGTPAPLTQSAAEAVSSAHSCAVSQAQQHYSRAKSVVSAQISGEPEPIHEEIFSSVEKAYSDSLDAASSYYKDALNAASTAVYGSRQQQMLDAANAKYSEAKEAAQSQLDSVKSAAGATSKPGYEKFISEASSRYQSLVDAASAQHASATDAASEAIYGRKQGVLESISAVASGKLMDSIKTASDQYESAKTALGATPTPKHQQYIQAAQRDYYAGVGLAHERYSEFVQSASSALYGTPTPIHENLASVASENIYGTSQGKFESMTSVVDEQASSVLTAASTAVVGSETPLYESLASQGAKNWESIVSRASENVYGRPTPFHESAYSQVGEYAAQATAEAAAQYAQVTALVSELLQGKEPDFTESVASRLSSAFYTNAASASSLASDAYASASSAVTNAFSVPASVEEIINAANKEANAAIEAASAGLYGTQKGSYEKATSAAAEAASKASEKVIGTPPSYLEEAQKRMQDIAASASDAIANAIYSSTASGATASATSVANKAYEAVSESVDDAVVKGRDAVEAGRQKIREAVYGPEKGAVESAQAKLLDILEDARKRIEELGEKAGQTVDAVQDAAGKAAGKVVGGGKEKDEL